MKYATRILVCVIAVNKSQEFLLKVRRLFILFSTTTPSSSRGRVVSFSTTTQGVRLRRQVDVFPTTSYTLAHILVSDTFSVLTSIIERREVINCEM